MDIYDVTAILSLLLGAVFGIFLLSSPFLAVKYILKSKFTWWIVLLCLIASFGIYHAEVWAWWRFWEWGFMKIGEAI